METSVWLDSLDVASTARIFAYLDLPDVLAVSTTCLQWSCIMYVLTEEFQPSPRAVSWPVFEFHVLRPLPFRLTYASI